MVEEAFVSLVKSVGGHFETPAGYQSPGLAVIDAVFSARLYYSTVERVVARVLNRPGLSDSSDFTIAVLLEHLLPLCTSSKPSSADDGPLISWFGDGHKSPGTSVPKARTVIVASQALIVAELSMREDFVDAGLVADTLVPVPGIGATSIRYLLLLLGHEKVKPDVWVLRWLSSVLGSEAGVTYTPEAAAALIEMAILRAKPHTGGATIRDGDHLIWQVASGRRRAGLLRAALVPTEVRSRG
jgi:hypothetical protein